MLLALLDGCEHTATELAQAAEVGAATASVHLARLQAADLVERERRGRHQFFRLRNREVASLLEAMASRAGKAPRVPGHLRHARSCYDHLAGEIGVAVHDRMRRLGWLSRHGEEYTLRAAGVAKLATWGIDLETVQRQRRKFATACLDWSERRPHLGGSLGAAVLAMALRKNLLLRELDSRALAVTPKGRRWLHDELGVENLTVAH